MKLLYLCGLFTLAFSSCSQPPPYHLPDSTYYRQQEATVLTAVSGQVMTHQFFIAPSTKSDTIGIYDSLAFPSRLKEQEISRVMRDHNLPAEFAELLRDTVNWHQARHPIANLPISQFGKTVSFTPKYISSHREAYPIYRLSRAVFNPDFTKAYFQLTWEDPGGGVKQYILCRKENGRWIVKAVDRWNSFKI
ncbi:hypothetical protein [Hymenobacter persicinus]|uniref:DUF3828 domain-containing protein n=1 Tax=Hymenobacter persicinus TaxID=2025506 RepID=A0A4Q5LEJ3_9BACT|nr:hypothetical protein [Hymenobacter persicinus]RYU80730.1 hypothetical protein EWM57_07705 [Hymenobacter persicinus]